jgi:hypothetical protein
MSKSNKVFPKHARVLTNQAKVRIMSLSNETTYLFYFFVEIDDIYFCSKLNTVKFILNCNFILLPMANKSSNSYFMEHFFI